MVDEYICLLQWNNCWQTSEHKAAICTKSSRQANCCRDSFFWTALTWSCTTPAPAARAGKQTVSSHMLMLGLLLWSLWCWYCLLSFNLWANRNLCLSEWTETFKNAFRMFPLSIILYVKCISAILRVWIISPSQDFLNQTYCSFKVSGNIE